VEYVPVLHHKILWGKMHTYNQQTILDWAYLFQWAGKDDFERAITGRAGRTKVIEYNLPRLVKRRKLKTKKIKSFGNRLFYSLVGNRKTSDNAVVHGLYCTDALIRFHLSKNGDYVSERDFRARRFKPTPEFGVRYEDGKGALLLFEHSTADNFRRKQLIDKKIDSYSKGLDQFKKGYCAEPFLVYVIDAPNWEVEELARKWDHNNFYFTDATQFYSVPYGEQLSAQIYIWRGEVVNLYA